MRLIRKLFISNLLVNTKNIVGPKHIQKTKKKMLIVENRKETKI